MQTTFRFFISLSACFYALPVFAQVLDLGLPAQVATTATGLQTDSTTVNASGVVTSRTLTATSPEACVKGKVASVSVASEKDGVTLVKIENSRKGRATVTWEFDAGASAQIIRNSMLEVVLANVSSTPEVVIAASATVVTSNKGEPTTASTTTGYTGIKLDQRSSRVGKLVVFDLQRSAKKKGPDVSATVIRSLTLQLSSPTACSSLIAVRQARLKPWSNAKGMALVTIHQGRNSNGGGQEGLQSPQASPSPNPSADPCNDPDVIAEMRERDKRRYEESSGCAQQKTSCSGRPDGSYETWISAVTRLPAGAECRNNKCEDAPGVCTYGVCTPPQFEDFMNPWFDVVGDRITETKSSRNGSLDWSCFDYKWIYESKQLCTIQPDELEKAILASMLVGKRCKLPDGTNKGICSNEGLCVPDPSSCESKSNCDVCGDPAEKKICWNNSCVTKEEAKFQLCQTTSPLGGGQGICLPCFAMINRNSDGVCGSSVIAVKPGDRRGFSMEGSPCWRPVMINNEQRGVKGICKNNTCVLNSLQSTPRPTGTPRS
jgi:hypothetical protein